MSASYDYATNLNDEQWAAIEPFLPKPQWQPGGPGRQPRDLRSVVNGIFYVNKTGCRWSLLPRDFAPNRTTYGYFRRWREQGVWAPLLERLRKWERRDQGRLEEPSAACADSQSIKIMTQSEEVGFDGNKKIKGRKRHILVDTLGLLLAVVVTSANSDDRQGLKTLLTPYFASGVKRLRKIWVDAGYEAKGLKDWVRELKKTHKIDLEVGEHHGKGFQVVAHRWKVERTFSWISNDRRNARDYETLPASSEAMIQISTIRMLLKRMTYEF
jgi:putative transposase